VAGALAVSKAVTAMKIQTLTVHSLQEYHNAALPPAVAVGSSKG
jgi:hypothetical protein